MGVLAAFGRIGSIAGQFVFGALISVSVHALLAVAAVMLVIGTPFAFVLPCVAQHPVHALWLMRAPHAAPRLRLGAAVASRAVQRSAGGARWG